MTIRCLDSAHGAGWDLYHGDCVSVARQLPDACVDFGIHSPPFANIYLYSDSELDMGNCVDDAEFFKHYSFLIKEHFRILRPGRLVAVHCKQLVDYMGSDGRSGLRDFRGEIIRAYEAAGFKYHSETTIWKSAPQEQRRTNAHGLLYLTLRKDGSFARQGLAEYLVMFRRWPRDEAEEALCRPVTHWDPSGRYGPPEGPGDPIALHEWQEWASPVWMTIDQTNVLNVEAARDDRDEKHMCPLQLDVIDRAVALWSNPGDVVFSPFAGIGSEGVGALRRGRRFVGIELKASYFDQARKVYLPSAEPNAKGSQTSLFAPLKEVSP